MSAETIDLHCKRIREALSRGDHTPITCLNYLKNHSSDPRARQDWSWVGAQLVMNGWLTVNDQNDYEVKV